MTKIEKSFDFIYVHQISRQGKFFPVDILVKAKAYIDAWDFVVSYIIITDLSLSGHGNLYDVLKTFTPELIETIEEGALQLARSEFEEPDLSNANPSRKEEA